MPVTVILIRPQHSGNLGSVARAMANMGLSSLRLVRPRANPNSLAARKMAMGGQSILEKIQIFEKMEAAIADLKLVVGTSRRTGKDRGNYFTPQQFAAYSTHLPKAHRVGIVFGPEAHGLKNEEIALCQRLIHIPSHPRCPSLNLAQAVVVVTYELFLAQLNSEKNSSSSVEQEVASVKNFEEMIEDWRLLLLQSGFLDKGNPEHMIRMLRNFFNRGRPSEKEVKIMRGICRQLRWWKQN
jgi:TrmH family RNA methyltransferase